MARRFVTYNTEDQQAGLVNVDHNGVMMPGGGLPSGGEPNQYLVTDSNGNTGWAERLAWKETKETELFTTEGCEVTASMGYTWYPAPIGDFVPFEVGKKYKITLNGVSEVVVCEETNRIRPSTAATIDSRTTTSDYKVYDSIGPSSNVWEVSAFEETLHPISAEYLPVPTLTSPNGTVYTLTVGDDGTLTATAVE